MHITSLLGNSQKLDGGAMFGNAPKSVWSKWLAPDDSNRIHLKCRCLLIQDGTQNILLEAGIGAFFDPILRERYGVQEKTHQLEAALKEHNLSTDDIDCVILSHLHFDHAGGLLTAWEEKKEPELIFKNARFYVSEAAWERSLFPHSRDRASFIPDLNKLLQNSGKMEIISADTFSAFPKLRFHFSHGHTPGMMMTEILSADGPVFFVGDLIPGTPWLHVPITMGYDRYPEQLINEKQKLLDYVLENKGRIFYTHDPKISMSRIQKNNKNSFESVEALETFASLKI